MFFINDISQIKIYFPISAVVFANNSYTKNIFLYGTCPLTVTIHGFMAMDNEKGVARVCFLTSNMTHMIIYNIRWHALLISTAVW